MLVYQRVFNIAMGNGPFIVPTMEHMGEIDRNSSSIISGWWFQTMEFGIVHFIYGMSSFPLTNSIIFQDGHSQHHQFFTMAIHQGGWISGRCRGGFNHFQGILEVPIHNDYVWELTCGILW